MSILDDWTDQDVQDVLETNLIYAEENKLYRQRIKKAYDILLRAIESRDYTPDTFADIMEALEGEYDME